MSIGGLKVHQATIDIGTVWAGNPSIQRYFTIENDSGHPIRIDSVGSDCGCTVPKVENDNVPNGMSAKIAVAFWPPPAAQDHGGDFRRTISVVVATTNGPVTIPLSLTGFLAPDASLRVSPLVLDFDETTPNTTQQTVLHLKAPSSLLADVPDTIKVIRNSDYRVLVSMPKPREIAAVATKDIRVIISDDDGHIGITSWNSTITFAPDQVSAGLAVRLSGHASPPIVASPESLMLTDDPLGREGLVLLKSRQMLEPDFVSVQTDLPLSCDFLPNLKAPSYRQALRVRVKRSVPADVSGTIRIQANRQSAGSASINIPVVILHRTPSAQVRIN